MLRGRSLLKRTRRGPIGVVLILALALHPGPAYSLDDISESGVVGRAKDSSRLSEISDDELAKGKEEVRSGAYDAGIITLSGVVRRLGSAEGREAEAAEAYLNLGVAYAGLGQVSPARSQFIQALLRNPQIALEPGVPPSAVEIFAAARKEADEQGLLKGPPKKSSLAGAPPKTKDQGAVAKSSHGLSTGAKLAIGLGIAAGVGVGVAVSGGSSNVAPSPPPLPTGFTPSGVQSVYVSLLMALPEPGNTLGAGAVITLTVRADNTVATPYEGSSEIKIIGTGYTGSGQACLAGERGPVSFTPRSRGDYVMTLTSICAAPYQTVRLQLSLFDNATNQFLFQSNYTGGYRIVP